MSHVLTTRLATLDDAPLIEGLEAVLQSRSEPNYARRLLESGRSVVLGFRDGLVCGYAAVNWEPSYSLFARLNMPELQDLNVLPDARGHGLGAMIVVACEALARERGCEQMGLAVGLTRSYGAAQRLYVRAGYLPDGYGVTYDREAIIVGRDYPVDDDLCLMMVKDLLP